MRKRLLVALINISILDVGYSQYMLYGTTDGGGTYNKGTIFSYNPITNKETVLFSFNGSNGNQGQCKLLYASDSLLYGIASIGGTYNMGTFFSFNWKTSAESTIVIFDGPNGNANIGATELIQAKSGSLYGTTWGGGTHGAGVLFCYDILTKKDTVLYNFDTLVSGFGSYRALCEDTSTGILYGVTEGAGKIWGGVLYGFNTITNKDSTYISFKYNGAGPFFPTSGLIRGANGLLYGMSKNGGNPDSGTIYTYDINTGLINVVFQFHGIDGAFPNANGLMQLSNGMMYGTTFQGGNQFGVLFSFDPINNTEIVLETFDTANGIFPQMSLIQDPDNRLLYGTTRSGSSANEGVLFSYDVATSTYTKLLDFRGANGAGPLAELTLVKDTSIFTGINKINESGGVRVYPNPSDGEFTVVLGHTELVSASQYKIEIYNMFGQNVFNEMLKQVQHDYEINLSSQPNGVYFYRVVTKSGGLVGEGKVVILR